MVLDTPKSVLKFEISNSETKEREFSSIDDNSEEPDLVFTP
jgi:hypothetical protein